MDRYRHGLVSAWWGKPGRAEKFSDAAIQFCLMVKNLFGLVLRLTTEIYSGAGTIIRFQLPIDVD